MQEHSMLTRTRTRRDFVLGQESFREIKNLLDFITVLNQSPIYKPPAERINLPPNPSPSQRWSGGAKVLGKLPVPGRPTNLDYSRTRAYCACSRCGWGLFGHFFSHL